MEESLTGAYIAAVLLAIGLVASFGIYAINTGNAGQADHEEHSDEPDRVIEMVADDWYFEPEEVTVTEGDHIRLVIESRHSKTEEYDHGIAIPALGVDAELPAGETTTVEFIADKPGEYEFHCNVYCGEGHDDMTGRLIVEQAADNESSQAEEHGHGDEDHVHDTLDKPDLGEISRHPSDMPGTTNYRLFANDTYQEVQPRNGSITQEFHLTVREGKAEVVNDTLLELWTFNGKVPGPMIRARAGDTIDLRVHNAPNNTMPHNIDCHCATGPGGGSVVTDTAPGNTSRFEFKLLQPGIYVYHCAFPDIPEHVSRGMYGLAVVEPRDGLPEVDHEYYMFQSEYYTTAGGGRKYTNLENEGMLPYSGRYGRLEEPTFVSFNGRPEAVTGDRAMGVYDETVEVNDSIRMFVGNGGTNLISSFHVIGEIFDTVYVEGSFDLENANVQTTLVPPGGATGVEFTTEVPGTYIPVDHALHRLHKGAKAQLHVEGPENASVYDPVGYDEGLRDGEY